MFYQLNIKFSAEITFIILFNAKKIQSYARLSCFNVDLHAFPMAETISWFSRRSLYLYTKDKTSFHPWQTPDFAQERGCPSLCVQTVPSFEITYGSLSAFHLLTVSLKPIRSLTRFLSSNRASLVGEKLLNLFHLLFLYPFRCAGKIFFKKSQAIQFCLKIDFIFWKR